MTPLKLVLSRLDGVQKLPSGFTARCPAHPDRSPSLSIREAEDGRVLLRCWAGCQTAAVVAAMGLTFADLFPPRESDRRGHGHGEHHVHHRHLPQGGLTLAQATALAQAKRRAT